MRAENCVLKSVRSEIYYRGTYADNALGLLAAPIPLYRSLLTRLSVFGATFQNFKVETPSLPDTHISCVLPDLNTAIRVRLDRFEVDCLRLHEIGKETAYRIVLATCAAIHEADDSTQLSAHLVDLNIFAEIQGGTCTDLISQYVRTPDPLGIMDLGVAFYTRPVQKGEPWINIVLDRVFQRDDQVLIRMTVSLDAVAVTLDAIALEVESKTGGALESLGLHFGTGGQK